MDRERQRAGFADRALRRGWANVGLLFRREVRASGRSVGARSVGKSIGGRPDPGSRRKSELLRMREADRKPFSTHQFQPKTHGDAASRHLDSVTLEQHLMDAYGLSRETVRTYLSPISGGGSGLGADALSAYCEYAADVLLPWDYEKGAQMFPGGNTGMARHILKQAHSRLRCQAATSMAEICRASVQFGAFDQPASATRIRLGSTAISVQHAGAPETSGVRRRGL